jgi:hypothetical protein
MRDGSGTLGFGKLFLQLLKANSTDVSEGWTRRAGVWEQTAQQYYIQTFLRVIILRDGALLLYPANPLLLVANSRNRHQACKSAVISKVSASVGPNPGPNVGADRPGDRPRPSVRWRGRPAGTPIEAAGRPLEKGGAGGQTAMHEQRLARAPLAAWPACSTRHFWLKPCRYVANALPKGRLEPLRCSQVPINVAFMERRPTSAAYKLSGAAGADMGRRAAPGGEGMGAH